MGYGQKDFQLVWRCYLLLSGFLAKGVSHVGDNEIILGGCGQIWHLPYSRGKVQKSSARRPSDEGAVRPVIASNGCPFPPNDVARIAQNVRKGKGRK